MKKNLPVLLFLILIVSVGYFKLAAGNDYEQQMGQMVPQASKFEHISGTLYRVIKVDEQNKERVIGFISTESANGYAGPLEVMTFINTAGVLKNLKVLSNTETPSFLAKVMAADYLEGFKGKKANSLFQVEKDIDGVSRATYTSKGIAEAVKKSSYKVAMSQLAMSVPPTNRINLSLEDYLLLGLILLVSLCYKYKLAKLRYFTLFLAFCIVGLWQKSPISLGNIASLLGGNLPSLAEVPFWFTLIAGVIILVLVTGRNLYCYWFCPMGALAELTGKLGEAGKMNYRPCARRVEQISRLRLFLAWGALVVGFFLANPSISSYEIFAPLFALQGNSAQWMLLPFMLFVGVIIYRFWCRFFCPVGAILDYLVQFRRRCEKWLKNRLAKQNLKGTSSIS